VDAAIGSSRLSALSPLSHASSIIRARGKMRPQEQEPSRNAGTSVVSPMDKRAAHIDTDSVFVRQNPFGCMRQDL